MLLIKRRNASSHISFSRVTQSVSRVPAYASKETHKQNGFHQPNEVPAIEWDWHKIAFPFFHPFYVRTCTDGREYTSPVSSCDWSPVGCVFFLWDKSIIIRCRSAVPLLGWMLSTEFDDEKTQLIDDGIVTRASFQNHLVFDYNIDMMAFYLISLFVTGLWYITRSTVYSNHFWYTRCALFSILSSRSTHKMSSTTNMAIQSRSTIYTILFFANRINRILTSIIRL